MQKQPSLTWKRVHIMESQAQQPSPRWGHACCVIEDQIVFFGGYADSHYMSDMWTFNSSTLRWKEIKPTGDLPENRSNCTMNYDPENNRIIVFGGGGPNKKRFNTIHVMDWNTKVWTQLKPKSNDKSPWERTYHTAQYRSGYLIVFGGQGLVDIDDLWVFDFKQQTWTEVIISEQKIKPMARRFHSSSLVGNQMYIIGGCYNRYRSLKDMFSLDLTSLIQKGECTNLEWKEHKLEDASFLTRWGHSSSVLDGKIYVFAGRFSNDLNDLLVIDVQANTIKLVKGLKESPKERRRHCATFVGSSLVVFGGFNGEYFNDLHYINIQQGKSWVTKSNILKNRIQLVNNPKYSDLQVKSKEGTLIHLSLEFISRSFQTEDSMFEFIEYLQSCSHATCIELLEFLYLGMGNISQQIYSQFKMKGELHQKTDIKNYFANLTNKLRGNWIESKTLAVRTQFSGVIQISLEQWQQALQTLQQGLPLDIEFVTDRQTLRCNKILLQNNSVYFSNLFEFQESNTFKPLVSSTLFKFILLFIITDYLILPGKLTGLQLIKLIKLSKYYNLPRLTSICEYQLYHQSSLDNESALKVAVQNGLKNLKLYCAQQQVRKLEKYENFNLAFDLYDAKEPKLTRLQSDIVDCKRFAYKKFYFDLQQSKITRTKIDDGKHPQKKTSMHGEFEKENSQINS